MDFDPIPLHPNVGNPRLAGQVPQPGHRQKPAGLLGYGTVTVLHFLNDEPNVCLRGAGRQFPVHLQAEPLRMNIGLRDVGVDR